MIESKDYYIDLINSSKANKMTALYHYSGVGFKKAKINQGIYRKSDNLLVGVLQWGCSAQEGVRLDRYVKESTTKDEYLELNRFCMADSEGKNSESQAISLGIKKIISLDFINYQTNLLILLKFPIYVLLMDINLLNKQKSLIIVMLHDRRYQVRSSIMRNLLMEN